MKLFKFYTDTCPQCKFQSTILEKLEGVEVEPVNCDEHPELVTKYQIRALPTLVLVDDNNEVLKKMSGLTQLNVIKEAIENASKS